jgi:hypothetical protein
MKSIFAVRCALHVVLLCAIISLSAHGVAVFTDDVDMTSNRVMNLDLPQAARDAATKEYVDARAPWWGSNVFYIDATAPDGGDGSPARPWNTLHALDDNSDGRLQGATVVELHNASPAYKLG